MISPFFFELGIIIIVATILGFFFHRLKQPIILAYLVTGVVLGASVLNVIQPQNESLQQVISLFSEIGIAFLLYLIGLNLNLNTLRDVGKAALTIGLGQIVFTATIGFALATAMGFDLVESLYLAVALTFSSTIIIVKILADKNELSTLYGKITVGVLLAQDFVAIIALLVIASSGATFSIENMLSKFFFGGISFLAITFLLSRFVIPKIFDSFAASQELLFLFGISWAFFLSGVSYFLGFSIEIGALIAGVTLASLPYSFDVAGKIRPLRDFFLVLFFVTLGSELVFQSANLIIEPAIIFSLFVLVGNPLIVIALMHFLGYKSRTSFMAGFSLAQISEFSLVLVALGAKLGHIGSSIVAIITLVGVVTISVSAYLVQYSGAIYDALIRRFPFIHRHFSQEELQRITENQFDLVFLGFNKIGHSIFHSAEFEKQNSLLIEFDPELSKELVKENYNIVFGDAVDPDTLELIKKSNPKLIVCTIRDFDVNRVLLKETMQWKNRPGTVLTTETIKTALRLYKMGASYVIIPQLLVGSQISSIVKRIESNDTAMEEERKKHFFQLEQMKKLKIE